jgi:hypothetical protein
MLENLEIDDSDAPAIGLVLCLPRGQPPGDPPHGEATRPPVPPWDQEEAIQEVRAYLQEHDET